MQFTTPIPDLKDRGYIYQKLYAAEYKTYRKEFGEHKEYTIWLYVQGKTIEINDWYSSTEAIINVYKANSKEHKKEYCILELNKTTQEVRLRDKKKYYKGIMKGDYSYMEGWREIIIYIPYFKEVLKEIEFLLK